MSLDRLKTLLFLFVEQKLNSIDINHVIEEFKTITPKHIRFILDWYLLNKVVIYCLTF
jgi:hypothetical protein